VTEAIYGAGFNSNSRFYETSNEVLGMTPTVYKNGGKDADIRFAVGECSIGSVLVALSPKGVCAILLGDDPDALARDLQDRFPQANLIGGDAGFEDLVAKVVGLVETPSVGLDLPLDIRGTAFQQRVWQALREIPAGRTASYTDIARRIGEPKACARGGSGLRRQQDRGGHSLPPRPEKRRRALRLPLGRRTQARPARQGGKRMSARRNLSRPGCPPKPPRRGSASATGRHSRPASTAMAAP
jgi:O6-methylguanine-DNA--protein-cysteine methyltransferase